MAKPVFRQYRQHETMVLPPSLDDFIDENHPCRIVSDVIDRLDLSKLEATYKGGGASSYDPLMLLKVIVYAYLVNVYSGRQIARLLKESVVFMWLSGMSFPDFRTINSFRSKRLGNGVFDGIFAEVVTLLNREGLVSLDVQYIDGTKIESAANKYTFVWKKSVEKNKAKLKAKITAVLTQAQEIAGSEASEGDAGDTPEDFAESSRRLLERMDEMKKEGKEESKEDKALRKELEKVDGEYADRLRDYDAKLEIMGPRNSYSKTDPDATFMRLKEDAMLNGQTKPAYNVQISTENQFITHYGIYQRPGDTAVLIPYLRSFHDTYGFHSSEICADSGYGSEENYEFMFGNSMKPYVKYNMFHKEMKKAFKSNAFKADNMFYNAAGDFYVCPMGQRLSFSHTEKTVSELGYVSQVSVYKACNCEHCPARGMCYKGKGPQRIMEVNHTKNEYRSRTRELLTSERGLEHRSKRPIEPESVFGDIKFNHGFRRFRLRSLPKVKIEFGLAALAHNLRKYAGIIASKTAEEREMMAA